MSTAEELQAAIAAVERQVEVEREATLQCQRDIEEAEERQRLRRILDALNGRMATQKSFNECRRDRRLRIDADESGPLLPSGEGIRKRRKQDDQILPKTREITNCSNAVSKGEFVWRIEGFSWLMDALQQNGEELLETERPIYVGGEAFDFCFSPTGKASEKLCCESTQSSSGTLVIRHLDDDGLVFRHKIHIRRRGGDFVQWGEAGSVCRPEKEESEIFGPDVHRAGRKPPQGVFGLSYEELLTSEWVENDTMTVRFELEVRAPKPLEVVPEPFAGGAPVSSIGADMLALLETGRSSDVTFVVAGEPIRAHSQILSGRSEVFERLFSAGMRESVSKEVIIEDCDAATFMVLLRFLYGDDFGCLEECLRDACAGDVEKGTAFLQSLLAVAHKYDLAAVRLWSERKLSERISVDAVCSILCQAHLHDAKCLEIACLTFIRQHHRAVAQTEKFGKFSREWPEILLKINMFVAGVSEANAAQVVDAHRGSAVRKRKRED